MVRILLIVFFMVGVFAQLTPSYLPESKLEERLLETEKQTQFFEKTLKELEPQTRLNHTRSKIVPNIANGRLTWVSGTPVPVTTSTTATIIYYTPYNGNLISLYYKGGWKVFRFTQISYTLTGLAANTNYDIFIYRDNTTQLNTLELGAAWTSSTARSATGITLQDGIYVKQGDATRRYLGTFRTNATATQYSFSETFRNLWNYYNRVPLHGRIFDATNTWTYNANAYRQAGADVLNDISFVIGVNEVLTHFKVKTNIISNAAAARAFTVGIGLDSTTANSALLLGGRGNGSGSTQTQVWAEYMGYPGIGYHTLSWIESCPAAANVTIWGDNGTTRTSSGVVFLYDG